MSGQWQWQQDQAATATAEREETPTDLGGGDWKQALAEVKDRYKEHRVPLTAGALAYYWFLSLFPALIALIGLVAVLGLQQDVIDTIQQGARTALPDGAADVITRAVESASQGPSAGIIALGVGLVIALWGASRGMAMLQQAADESYEVPAEESRGFFAQRAVALVMLAATAVLGLLAAAFVVFGQPIGDAINDYVPVSDQVFTWAWTAVRWIIAAVLIATLFSVMFYLAPSRRRTGWRWITPGGALAAGIWLLASLGFSFYTGSDFGNFGDTYGGTAGVVVLIIWLYLTALATLLGAELNAALEKRAVGPTATRR